jgi:hypothetical protein
MYVWKLVRPDEGLEKNGANKDLSFKKIYAAMDLAIRKKYIVFIYMCIAN